MYPLWHRPSEQQTERITKSTLTESKFLYSRTERHQTSEGIVEPQKEETTHRSYLAAQWARPSAAVASPDKVGTASTLTEVYASAKDATNSEVSAACTASSLYRGIREIVSSKEVASHHRETLTFVLSVQALAGLHVQYQCARISLPKELGRNFQRFVFYVKRNDGVEQFTVQT